MKNSLPNWCIQADADIKSGNGSEVVKKLRRIQKAGVPPDHVLEVSKLARRVGMYHFATNILFRDINDPLSQPIPEKIAEYGACLAGSGNYLEAKRVFSTLAPNFQKDHAITYAESFFKEWDYQGGLRVLETFMPQEFQTYKDLVYKLNLAAAYLECDKETQALVHLEQLCKIGKAKDYAIIYGNALEMRGQIQFRHGDYDQALKMFTESERILKKTNNISWLYSYKWLALTRMAKAHDPTEEISSLDQVRAEARKLYGWETLRACDMYQSILTRDEKLFSRSYFGSPHQLFRNRMLAISEGKIKLNPVISIGPGEQKESLSLDLRTIEFSDKVLKLNNSELFTRLIISLTKDLYRPLSIYQIHFDLYPGEVYNPLSSNQKTYISIMKFKKKIQTHPIGFEVSVRRNYGYRLRTNHRMDLIYPFDNTGNQIFSKQDRALSLIRQNIGEQEFDRSSFCNLVSLNDRAGNRLLKALEQDGSIARVGAGRSTKYKLAG